MAHNLREKRIVRHRRVRAKIKGTSKLPRLSVFRSSKYIYLQVIDDAAGKTLFGISDRSIEKGTKFEKAYKLGKAAAGKILEKNIKKIVFDRGGFRYHGRVKALADGLREGGLIF